MARRVNTKFLTIFTIAVVGLGMAALIINRFFVRESPEKYVVLGQQFMAEKKYEQAVTALGRASQLSGNKSPELLVAYGDALDKLSPEDIEFMVKARRAWDQALLVDPNYKPALDRMMN